MSEQSSGVTRVVNLRREKYDVYIGRAGKGQDGYFGNPIRRNAVCPVCGGRHDTNGSTLDCFRIYFTRRLRDDSMFRAMVEELKGKRLGCFCKPGPCHGDVIKEYLDDKV